MKAQDIVDKLAAKVPLYTDRFGASVGVLSISVVGTTATATTDTPHGIIDGQNVAITGATAPVQIDTGGFIRTGSTVVFETLQDHDFTLSQRDIAAGGKSITISGATEPEFNGTFELIEVTNRRTLMIAVTDSGPTSISGAPIIEDANGNIFNGLVTATNVTANAFDYELPITYPLNAVVDNASIGTSIRIISVLDIVQFLNDVYTKQDTDDDYLVVQLGDVSQSQNRNEKTDASDSSRGQDGYLPDLIQSFAVYIVQNVTDELTATQARDLVESEYIPAIFRSVLLAEFNTGFTYGGYRSTFTGHGVYAYADQNGKNKSVYVHEVTFQQICRLDRGADTAGNDETVALRDVSFTLSTNLGTQELLADVDLDQEPV